MMYQPYQPPTYGQFQRQEVIKVNGRQGAEMYQMGPDSSVLLLDTSAPIVWLKSTDGAGYPTLTPYSITLYQPEKPVNLKDLVKRIDKLEEAIHGKSNSYTADEVSRNDETDSAAD